MILNFNVRVKAGARTPVEVEAHCTAVNEKTITFLSGRTLTSGYIAEWLQENLARGLRKVEIMEGDVQ